MSTYQYTAKDKNGNSVVGILDCASDAEAVEILHQKDLVVVSIKQAKKKGPFLKDKKIKTDDLVIFTRQLSTLIDAGIPLVQSLAVLSEQTDNKNLKNVMITMRQDIEAGSSFSDTLAKHPQVFSEIFMNMARAGEVSGTLDEILDRLATYLEKNAALTRKIRSSLVYPAVVVSVAILITAFLLIKVVPTFKGIFDILGGELPLPTRILIGVSELLRRYFPLFLVLLAGLSYLFKRYINTEKGRYYFDARKLRLPILGQIFRKVAIVKFCSTFATLVKSGVSVLSALDIVAKTAGNKVIEKTVMNCRVAVRDGELISRPLSKSGVFPPMVCRMILVGEQTGQLEKMLNKITEFYEQQVDAMVTGLTSIIEPVIITFLGVVIGGIVISLFLPIFKITQLIAK